MEEIKKTFDFLIEEGYEDRYESSVVERDEVKSIDVTDTWLGTTAFSLESYKSGDTDGFLITFPGDDRDSILVGYTEDSNPWAPMASELDKYDQENQLSTEKRLAIWERKLDEALERENELYAEKVALEIKLNISPTWNAFPGLDEWKKLASPGDYVFIFDACPSPLRINFDGTGFTDVHGYKFDMGQWKALTWIPWPEVNKRND
jgi:hypothetical protein